MANFQTMQNVYMENKVNKTKLWKSRLVFSLYTYTILYFWWGGPRFSQSSKYVVKVTGSFKQQSQD